MKSLFQDILKNLKNLETFKNFLCHMGVGRIYMNNNSNDIDSVLIDKAKNGNEGAFKILVNKYYPRVYASLFSFTKSKEDSEDLTQQTFLKVWQQLDTFRGDSAFFTWVYRIAINLAKNFVVSSSYKKQRSNIPMEDLNIDFSSFDSVEKVYHP